MWLPCTRWPEGCTEKHNMCSGWAQLKQSTLTYMSNGAFAHFSAVFGCKITVNMCRHFLFKSLNLQTARRRWIFLFQTFSKTSQRFSLVTVSRLCCFTATEEWTRYVFLKKSTDLFLTEQYIVSIKAPLQIHIPLKMIQIFTQHIPSGPI